MPTASTVKLSGEGSNLRIKSNGGSTLKLGNFTTSGKGLIVDSNGGQQPDAERLRPSAGVIKASGASHLDLGEVKLAAADVTLDGASHAKINVSDKLDYSLSGWSHLEYSGEPNIGKSSKHGGSHLNHHN